MEMAGVSSMNIGAFDSRPAALVSKGQSDGERNPVRTLCASTWACEHSMRWTNCSLDISREKIATGTLCPRQAFSAMDTAKALFPIDGRPAMMIKSDFCKPEV